jgi:hypothetical protein
MPTTHDPPAEVKLAQVVLRQPLAPQYMHSPIAHLQTRRRMTHLDPDCEEEHEDLLLDQMVLLLEPALAQPIHEAA